MAEHVTPPVNNSFNALSDDPSAQGWTVVEVFNSEIEAAVAQGALEAEGIAAMLTNQTFGSVLPIGFNSIGGIRLWVPASKADEAVKLLRANHD